jgi:hypothetical protein
MISCKPTTRLRKLAAIVLLVPWIVSMSSLSGDSTRINNRVIDTGMSKGKVFLITGQPDWKASYLIGDGGLVEQYGEPIGGFSNNSHFFGYSGTVESFGTVAVEEWLFNRGRQRLMQLLRFENERLVAIDNLGYGFNDTHNPSFANPDWSTLKIGDTAYEVRNKFGEPSLAESKPEISYVRITGPLRHTLHYQSAEVSWWYYNNGSNRLFRIIKLVNGRVVEVETEGFGISGN